MPSCDAEEAGLPPTQQVLCNGTTERFRFRVPTVTEWQSPRNLRVKKEWVKLKTSLSHSYVQETVGAEPFRFVDQKSPMGLPSAI